MIRKWLAIGIILLFVGVTIAPTINFNTVKASNDDDLVEVTTRACGIKGYGNTTVKLTREQYQNLESYLVDFRARLNQTSTREEAIPIFKDAVSELDKYGLLPKGMSIKTAQKLVISQLVNKRINTKDSSNENNNNNYFCLIAGHMNNTFCVHRTNLWIYRFDYFVRKIFDFLMGISPYRFPLLFTLLFVVYQAIDLPIYAVAVWFPHFIVDKNPIALFNIFGVGIYAWRDNVTIYAGGWANSYGLLGNKAWNGSLIGNLHDQWVVLDDYFYLMYPGIVGFNGIKIGLDDDNCEKFFLGSALAVGFDIKQ